MSITIPAGRTFAVKTLRVRVRNADLSNTAGYPIQLSVDDSDCGGGVAAVPDFQSSIPGAQDSITIADGSTKTAKVVLTVTTAGFMSFNRHAPHRCTLWFTASADLPSGYTDPMPSNNVIPVEVSVLDRNDPDQTTVHETTIASLKPVALTMAPGRTSATKTARPKVGNADASEVPGDTIGVVSSDGTCPPGMIGALHFVGGGSVATVRGGATQTCTLPLMVASSQVQTTNKLSPQRCVVTVNAIGPGGDIDGSNNTTRLVVDVLDKNDL